MSIGIMLPYWSFSWVDMPEGFCCHFAKGDNFWKQEIASLVIETFTKWGYSWRKEFASSSLRVGPNEKGGNHFHVTVNLFVCESVPIKSLIYLSTY